MKKKFLFLVTIFLGFGIFMPDAMAATTDPQFCVRTSAIWQFVGYGIFVLKILIPIIIIVFGVIDFVKAVLSGDDKGVKGAAVSLLKRAIVGMAIFFVPTIVKVIFDMIDNITGGLNEIEACETCLLDPTSGSCDAYIKQAEDLRASGN